MGPERIVDQRCVRSFLKSGIEIAAVPQSVARREYRDRRVDQRIDQPRSTTGSIGEQRSVEIDAVPGIDLRLPIKIQA